MITTYTLDECAAFVQLFKLYGPTDANDQSQGDFNLRPFARPLGVTMVLSGMFILIIGESYDGVVTLCILTSIGRRRTFLHDPVGPPAGFLPGRTQLPRCRDNCPCSRRQHHFGGIIC
jgi:hypothetical protein